MLLDGCVQPSMAPNVNAATTRVLDALGIEGLRPKAAGWCGVQVREYRHLLRPDLAELLPSLAAELRSVLDTGAGQHDVSYTSP